MLKITRTTMDITERIFFRAPSLPEPLFKLINRIKRCAFLFFREEDEIAVKIPAFLCQDLMALSAWQKKAIEVITVTMAEGPQAVFKSERHIRAVGEHIKNLHPFQFLGHIFSINSPPFLKEAAERIFNFRNETGFRGFPKRQLWNIFSRSLFANLTKEANRNNLEPYLENFAREVGADKAILSDLIQEEKWISFIDYLISCAV